MQTIRIKISYAARRYFIYLTLIWTVLILIAAGSNLYQARQEAKEKARIEARTIFEHNIAYRRWNSMLGGIYAPVSRYNQPNSYLTFASRDKTTTDGVRLTLINPFQMTKQAYDLLQKQSSLAAINRTVSLKPLNPENEPDPWEHKALQSFTGADSEVSEITTISGRPYMRILKPYMTVQGCLKCHGLQGYEVGDIRGGMSIAVPMGPYLASEKRTGKTIVLSHFLLWGAGILGIAMFTRSVRRHQERIAESEWKFRTLSEFAYDWEYWIDEHERLVFMSPSCRHVTGYAPEEFLQDPGLLAAIVHDEDQEAFQKHLDDFQSLRHEEREIRIVTKSGQVKWLSHGCEPIMVGDTFLGRRVSNRDITDRKNLEEQLRQSQKMESLGVLAGGIAHDFNNLLTAVTGYASMLRKKFLEGDETVRGYLDNILNAAKQAKSLTSSLLTFSRKQVMRPDLISLKEVMESVSTLAERLIGEDVELRISGSSIEFPVHADRHQLEQVLMNLVTNARDAMPSGGTLTVGANPVVLGAEFTSQYGVHAGSYMLLSVSDTGSGIDAGDLPHIFDPFFTKKEKGKGTGLGLSIVYGIVKQHGGFITVESQKGAGTTFRLYFPAVPAEHQRKGPSSYGFPAAAAAYSGSETVLVAEDEGTVRTFLDDILQAHGYRTVLAEDGLAAIERYRSNRDRIDAAILDVVMPRKNGREVYDVIQASNPDCKIIFISGYGQDVLTAKGMPGEGLVFLQKPLEVDNLLAALRGMLDRSPAAKETDGSCIT